MALSCALLDAIAVRVTDRAEMERTANQWRRLLPEMDARAALREQVTNAPCSCADVPSLDVGRCSRCHGGRKR